MFFDNELTLSQKLKVAHSYFMDDNSIDIARMVKEFLEFVMELEFEDHLIEMKRDDVQNSKNGFRYRNLLTASGAINDIKVPRDRKCLYKPGVFKRYNRTENNVRRAIVQMYLHGVSQRKVGEVLDALTGVEVSAGFVSQVTKEMDKIVKEFHNRRFDDCPFVYLFLDGLHAKKMNAAGKQEKCVVFVAYGVGEHGERQMIDFRIGKSESTKAWETFLDELDVRGVHMSKLKLVITDGGTGLTAAVENKIPFVEHQTCWFHKMTNVAAKLPKKFEKECISDARKIYLAESAGRARKIFASWKDKWIGKVPDAVKCIEKDLDKLLVFLSCPEKHRVKIRTTNVIERAFRELRRRLKVMGHFRDTASAERILCALMVHNNKKYSKKRNLAKWILPERKAA